MFPTGLLEATTARSRCCVCAASQWLLVRRTPSSLVAPLIRFLSHGCGSDREEWLKLTIAWRPRASRADRRPLCAASIEQLLLSPDAPSPARRSQARKSATGKADRPRLGRSGPPPAGRGAWESGRGHLKSATGRSVPTAARRRMRGPRIPVQALRVVPKNQLVLRRNRQTFLNEVRR